MDYKFSELAPVEKHILIRLHETIKAVDTYMNKYEYSMASNYLYNFVYDDFCSNYLEMSKVTLQGENEAYKNVVRTILVEIVRSIILMIYPFAPFIAEELYQALPEHKESIMLETYPEAKTYQDDVSQVELLMKMIAEIRNYKVSNKLAPNYALKLAVESKEKPFDGFETYLKRFTFAKEISFINQPYDKGMKYTYGQMTLYIEDEISKEELEEKRAKDIAFLESEIKRCEGMLNNPNFVARAPKEKVDLEKEKLAQFKKRLSDLL